MSLSRRTTAAPPLDHETLGLEGRVVSDDHQSLKLWLRLLSCTTQVETMIRKRLRAEAGMTLARFDFMAQLHRHPDGLTMSVLSRYLMVTGGNVTGLADELEKEGLVERASEPHDRRSSRVSLTRKGRRLFDKLAATHESWVVALFAGMSHADMRQMYLLLGTLRTQLAHQDSPAGEVAAGGRSRRPSRITTRLARRSGAPS